VANEDLFAKVTVTDKGVSGFPIPERTSYVLVRIPFEVAASLCGQNPTHGHTKMFQRFAEAASNAKGMPSETNIMQVVEDVVPVKVDPSHLSTPTWKDESGVEAWLLPPTLPADAR
jgi:hypothetical protein